MNLVSTAVLAASVLVTPAAAIAAQVKTIPAETITATATIEAIEQKSRVLTLKNEDGTHEMVQVPASVTRFSELKVGDKITARYYSSLIVRLKKPGEAAIDVEKGAITPGSGASPAGTVATQRTLTVTVVAIDPKIPSITVKSANGWTYSRRVEDPKALAQLKVGDKLDITWNDAVLVSATPQK
jgi:hypothetical protein